jgi:hypothetical protein
VVSINGSPVRGFVDVDFIKESIVLCPPKGVKSGTTSPSTRVNTCDPWADVELALKEYFPQTELFPAAPVISSFASAGTLLKVTSAPIAPNALGRPEIGVITVEVEVVVLPFLVVVVVVVTAVLMLIVPETGILTPPAPQVISPPKLRTVMVEVDATETTPVLTVNAIGGGVATTVELPVAPEVLPVVELLEAGVGVAEGATDGELLGVVVPEVLPDAGPVTTATIPGPLPVVELLEAGVGVAEGVADGELLGAGVGVTEGATDGETLGAGVGATEALAVVEPPEVGVVATEVLPVVVLLGSGGLVPEATAATPGVLPVVELLESGVGVADGGLLGAGVGVADGGLLGAGVGVTEGVTVGELLGAGVGATEGATDGGLLGAGVGVTEGVTDGEPPTAKSSAAVAPPEISLVPDATKVPFVPACMLIP